MGKINKRLKYYMRNYKLITCLGLLMLVCMFTGIQIHAEDTVETAVENTGFQGKLMVAIVDTEARDMPKVEGAVTVEIPKGTPLLTVGEENNWYEFYYQGKVAYVAKGDVEDANIDMAALDDEMKKNIEEDSAYIESLEMQRKALRQRNIWRIVITILIVLIFVVGVVSALSKNRNKNKFKRPCYNGAVIWI